MTPERWQKIEKVYHAALERDESERAAYLAGACAGDDALRQEVESLLAQVSATGSFLEGRALEVAAQALAGNQSSSFIGRQLGSYKILSLLGAGGMGAVYKARDTKLGREVAVKVLPPVYVRDPEWVARFEREARMLAALNHPNIATIHGLEQSEGAHYLLMELVPGETLAERVGRGPVAIKETLEIGKQIAEALEAAHEKGVMHRDLKPANVKMTPEGRVKVLDFGLAKAFAGDGAQDLSQAATLTALPTEEGKILGTPAYMSPEQARGKPVDKRTDIWAFGCVLYELLTARQAYGGDTMSDTIAAVLEREPEWQALPPSTPPKIRDLLQRCLRKDSQSRLHDIADARIEIEETLTASATAVPIASTRWRVPGSRRQMPWAIAFVIGAVLMTTVVWILKQNPPTVRQPVSRVVITLPAAQQLLDPDTGPTVAISPDGSHLVYAATQGGTQQLYLRAMDSLEARPIPGTEGAVNPFFSPDGQWVGFFAGQKLKKVSVSGGAVLTLCDVAFARGVSWGSQGMIAFSPQITGALQQVSDAGGAPQPLTRIDKGENSHRWPDFLPGGKAVLFSAGTPGANWTNAQVVVESVGTGERRNLIQAGTQPRYAPSGHLVYAQGGSLMAVPFDPQRLAVTGAAVPVLEGVQRSTSTGAAQYAFSATGSLVYVAAGVQAAQLTGSLVWVSRNGAEQPLAAPERAYLTPRLSPDGRRVAVAIEEQEAQIWLYDLARETLTRLTFEGNTNDYPSWTPDSKRVAFASNKEGPVNIFWQLADGSGGLERLTTGEYNHYPHSWSPDGQLLAFIEINPTTGFDIWVLRRGDRKAQPFLRTRFRESVPRFSPDGRWLAYVSDESGRDEIYVQPYPGSSGKWQVSTEGGMEPVWNPNGRELFYRNGDKMMAVDIATQHGLTAGKPRMLFEAQYQPTKGSPSNYDVTPDGQRFLMLKPSEQAQAAPTQINVVLNWFEELKRRVPPGKK